MTPAERLALVREALDVREEKAENATPGPWVATMSPWHIEAPDAQHTVCRDQFMRPEDRTHIVAHDPATVLREVAAGQAMCDLYEWHTKGDHGTTACAGLGCRMFVAWSDALLLDRL